MSLGKLLLAGETGSLESIDGVVGAWRSILTVSLSPLELPALSSTEQLTGWLPSPATATLYGPLPVTVAGEPSTVQVGVAAMPLVASATTTATDTGLVLFQPAPLALWLTEIDGSTVSIVTVSASLLGFVALSETEQLTGWLPSPVTDRVHVPAEPVSVAGEPSTVQLGAAVTPDPAAAAAPGTVT